MECLFCQIANREKSSDVVWEDDEFFSFKDINPKSRIHVLVIPKRHIDSVSHMDGEDVPLIGNLFLAIQQIARNLGIQGSGYRLEINVGRGGGQIIDHLHVHLLAD